MRCFWQAAYWRLCTGLPRTHTSVPGATWRRRRFPGAQEDIFALTDLEQEGDLYTSTSVDPRMELDLAAVSPTGVPAYVRRVTVRVTFLNMDPAS